MLVACVECGEKISNEAKVCPHCGFPIWKEAKPFISAERLNTVKDYATSHSKAVGHFFVCLMKIILWVVLAWLLGVIGMGIAGFTLKSGLFGWVAFIIVFPAAISMPTMALGKKLIGRAFKNVFSALCGTFGVPTAATIVEPITDKMHIRPDQVIIVIVGMVAAVGWSAYFFKDSDGWTSPRWMQIAKTTIFTLNICVAITFVLTLVFRL